jgi:DNA-binding NtrC family response regulator
MATTPPVEQRQVGILVLDADAQSQGALKQILDSEGWRVRFVPEARSLLAELATGDWSLVLANVTLTPFEGPAFHMLRELAAVSPEDGGRVRCLFMIPEMAGGQYVGKLEQSRLPYVLRPFHLHDFLEKISDLLVEIKAIDAPLRQVKFASGGARKKKGASRATSMFAARDSYSYSEEEMAEYEKQEQESTAFRKKRPDRRTDLGKPER